MKALIALASIALISAPANASTLTEFRGYFSAAAKADTSVVSEEDLMGGKTKHALLISSENAVRNSIGRNKTVSLVLRCNYNGKGFQAFVSTPTYNARNILVKTRWDQGKVTSGNWNRGARGTSFFHPRSSSFLTELLNSDTLTFSWNPYQRSSEAARWNLSAVKSDIESIKSLCH
jgi:hypothetical protein